MSGVSYTAEGFRAAFRRPALTLAEITWRWTVGATGGALASFSLFEYLSSVPISNRELLFLRTRQPVFVAQVIGHMIRGSLNRVVLAGLIGSSALCGLWILAASIGRTATVRDLLEYFYVRTGVASKVVAEPWAKVRLRPLVRVNFLRAALLLGAILAVMGVAILAGFASPNDNPQPGLAFLLFLPLAALTGWVWWALNWLLSLAGIFAVRDREDALGAISAAVAFAREHAGPVFAVSVWTGLAHFVAFLVAMALIAIQAGLIAAVRGRLVVAGMILVTLVYFAVADWLYMARLAGYVSIAEMPHGSLLMAPLPLTPPRSRGITPTMTAIDRDEPILSDMPNLAVET